MRKTLKAFTLIELIVVLVILGILAALAIPTFNALKEGAAENVAVQTANSIVRNAEGLAALDSAVLTYDQVEVAYNETFGGSVEVTAPQTVTIGSGSSQASACITVTDGVATVADGACA